MSLFAVFEVFLQGTFTAIVWRTSTKGRNDPSVCLNNYTFTWLVVGMVVVLI